MRGIEPSFTFFPCFSITLLQTLCCAIKSRFSFIRSGISSQCWKLKPRVLGPLHSSWPSLYKFCHLSEQTAVVSHFQSCFFSTARFKRFALGFKHCVVSLPSYDYFTCSWTQGSSLSVLKCAVLHTFLNSIVINGEAAVAELIHA